MTTAELVGHSLAENEEIINRGLSTFVEVGQALMEIRDERQYHLAGFDTFEDYCRERFDISRSYALEQIGAAQVVAIATDNPPQTEWVARPLVKLLNQQGEDAVRQTWARINEVHEDNGPITGKEVRRFLTAPAGGRGRAGWFELLGEASEFMAKAERSLDKLEQQIADSGRPKADLHADLKANAKLYRQQALALSRRLRDLAA